MSDSTTYRIKNGDTLSGIAKQFQHRKWETIWNAPENRSLVSKRRKPELIQAGDVLNIPPTEQQAKKLAAAAKTYAVTIGGKTVHMPEKEYAAFGAEMASVLKRTAVAAAEQRVEVAKTYWHSFEAMGNDQKVVSWIVGAFGPKLPPESMIAAAEQALAKLRSAVESGDFKRIAEALRNAPHPINKAYAGMVAYRDAVIGRSGTVLTTLTFTSDSCFDVLEWYGKSELGGAPATAGAVGAMSAFVKSMANELGRHLAGTDHAKAAAKRVVLDSVLGAAKGSASAFMKVKGDKIVEGVAKSLAKKLVSTKWLGAVAAGKLETFIANRLRGAAKGALESSVENGIKLIKLETTPVQFMQAVEKDVAIEASVVELDDWLDEKAARVVYKELIASVPALAGIRKDYAVEFIGGRLKAGSKKAVETALEAALEKARGHETIDQIGSATVAEMKKPDLDKLAEELLRQQR